MIRNPIRRGPNQRNNSFTKATLCVYICDGRKYTQRYIRYFAYYTNDAVIIRVVVSVCWLIFLFLL